MLSIVFMFTNLNLTKIELEIQLLPFFIKKLLNINFRPIDRVFKLFLKSHKDKIIQEM